MSKRPNIVMFCTDHQRADYLGCAGHPLIKTPNLDRLAARGVRYENLYIQNTVCMPSRASILTGTYPCRHGVTSNGYNLTEKSKTIAETLHDAGYHTMAVGRTHLVCTRPRPDYPKSDFFGFDQCTHAQVYCGDTDPHNDYLAWVKEEHPEYYEEIAFCNRKPAPDMFGAYTEVPEELSMNSWVVGRSLDFIKEHNDRKKDQPFFLWAGTWDPHSPYRAPEPWGSMYDPEDIPIPVKSMEELEGYPPELKRLAHTEFRRNPEVPIDEAIKKGVAIYMGMVSHIDDQLGRLLDGLEEMGIIDDTIILFTSDHGDMLGEHWFLAKLLYFYNGVLKVPGIMAGPGVPQGKCLDGLAETVDLMPTLLDLAGVEIPPSVQGKSWLPVLNGEDKVLHNETYTEHQYFAYPENEPMNEHVFSIFDGRYRIVYFKGRTYGQLFDLEKDPDCLINQWDNPDYAEVKAKLEKQLMNRIMDNLTRYDARQDQW